MARSYSIDLRSRILKDYDSGVPIDDLTMHNEVSRSCPDIRKRSFCNGYSITNGCFLHHMWYEHGYFCHRECRIADTVCSDKKTVSSRP